MHSTPSREDSLSQQSNFIARFWLKERKKERNKERKKERVQTCGRVSERVRVCTGCGAVSHAAVSCHVSVGLFFLACGALCGVASAEGHRLPLSTLRLHSFCTPGKRSGRWRTFERRQLRTSLSGLLSLSCVHVPCCA